MTQDLTAPATSSAAPRVNRDQPAPTLTEAAAVGAIDLALVMVPAAAAPDVVREAGVAGVGVCVVMSSGFAETGEEGRARQDELVRVARQSGVRLVGPNCIGSVGFAGGQVACFSPLFTADDVPLTPGRLGFVTHHEYRYLAAPENM